MNQRSIRSFTVGLLRRVLERLDEPTVPAEEEVLEVPAEGKRLRLARHCLYVNWKAPKKHRRTGFPAQDALFDRLEKFEGDWFKPYAFAYNNSHPYHFHLSFLIQALELLPQNLDLAFDALWRAVESLWRDHLPICAGKKIHECAPVIGNSIAGISQYRAALTSAFSVTPVQVCEFIVDRLFGAWSPTASGTLCKRIMDRLGHANSFPHSVALMHAIAAKYSAPISRLEDRRKATMLLRLALYGRSVTVGSATFTLSEAERVSFLINVLLYTYRNDRFHGSMQPPFKSSKATLQTYAHVHYCFLWAHLLFVHGATLSGFSTRAHSLAADNASDNFSAFGRFYDKHLNR